MKLPAHETLPSAIQGWAVVMRRTGDVLHFNRYANNPSVVIAEFIAMETPLTTNALIENPGEGKPYKLTTLGQMAWRGETMMHLQPIESYRCVKITRVCQNGWRDLRFMGVDWGEGESKTMTMQIPSETGD